MTVIKRREYDRKPLVRGLCGTQFEFSDGIVHAVVRDKGLLVSSWGYGDFCSYPVEFFEGRFGTEGNFYLRDRDCIDWVLVYDNTLHIFYPHHGLRVEEKRYIRFKGEYPPFDRSITLGKHVIMLALFVEGLNVLQALGKDRVGMIRRLDGDKDNYGPDNLELYLYKPKSVALKERLAYLAKHRQLLGLTCIFLQ